MKYSKANPPIACIQTNSRCYKNTRVMKPLGVLWHSTGANNPNIKRYVQPLTTDSNYQEMINLLGVNAYKNDYNHKSYSSGLNAFIGKTANGDVATVQTMPWNYRPWGCGSGKKGSCNNGWIQFEICEDSLKDKAYFDAVYKEACELTAYLCTEYGLDPTGTVTIKGVKVPVILCHQDSYQLKLGGNHADVYHWFKLYGKTMDDVRKDVAALMGKTVQKPEEPAQTINTGYKVRVKATTLNIRKGPGTNYSIAGQIKKGGVYTIVNVQNGWGKLKSGVGWIKLSYIERL